MAVSAEPGEGYRGGPKKGSTIAAVWVPDAKAVGIAIARDLTEGDHSRVVSC